MKRNRMVILAAALAVLLLAGCGSQAQTTPAASRTPSPTTAAQTATPTTPALPATSGWRTYTNASLGITLDYPPDWTVSESAGEVQFVSPKGFNLLLAKVDTGGLSPQQYLGQEMLPNTRCTNSTNPYGVAVRTCFDTIARTYTTYLVVGPAQGEQGLFSIGLGRGGNFETLQAIIASVRPAA